ncbi:hypothetical protein L210DRAFT_2061691 [Boletus edulis BED1]|uniref:Uncharacterized protein n=1 Tax=Boletus edulis BED1 TaxID=1328754 RepID=A0AAD4CAY1_BOLED|nr:hypothetical protein L210DRAFT_2061691 [Boletus edulis BED1]
MYPSSSSLPLHMIMCQPWTRVSTMFVVVRYIGLYWIMVSALAGSTFVPGPLLVSRVVSLSTYWTSIVFFSAADLVMILRVYAIWGRSKTILCILLFIYVLTGITAIVLVGIYDNPNIYLLVTIVQVLDFSLCSISFGNVLPSVYLVAPQSTKRRSNGSQTATCNNCYEMEFFISS